MRTERESAIRLLQLIKAAAASFAPEKYGKLAV